MKKSSFVEGTIIATIAIVIVKIIGIVYVIPFYAIIGERGSALYSYAYNIYQVFLNISSAGIPIAISKIINEYDSLGYKDAKIRAYSQGKKLISIFTAFAFFILFIFAKEIAYLIIGNIKGGNSIEDVTYVIRCISFAVLVIPYLSVVRGFLQGHNIITPSSVSQVLEQLVRIFIIIVGSYLAVDVFRLSITKSVGIAVSGAFFGGLIAYLYLLAKVKKNKKELNFTEKNKKNTEITNKEIRKKIISYAIPFIIINITSSIYNFTNMVLILRTLSYLGFSGFDSELITSMITTWSVKLNTIVGALATGMAISLIPNIVSAHVKKDWKDVNNKLNKAMQIILIISIPITVGLSLLSKPVWTLFYGASHYGPLVFAANIFTALFSNLFVITNTTLQGLNKFKIVYKSAIIGFVANAILDVPLMLLFNRVGLYPFYGAILSTAIGYSISFAIALICLKKEHKLEYKTTFNMLKKILLPTALMILSVLIVKFIFKYNENSRIESSIFILLSSFVGGTVFLYITYKNKLLFEVFGKEYLDKIIKKLTFGKVRIK